MTNLAYQKFIQQYNSIEDVVEFDESWSNGTGYFNNAVYYSLKSGERRKSVDDKGRKIILVGTRFGTCVIFERYAGSHIVCNLPDPVQELLGLNTRLYDEQTVSLLTGDTAFHNIGLRLETLISLHMDTAG
ncbi:MAG TPA: hypothetical protein VFM18_07565 [Methanosarcina sp.]|nr:hypothetical protein [Methanosarcina sp.]